jgi:aspartate/methionine/tyrosine aminotransferase
MKHKFISKRYWNSVTTPMGKIADLVRFHSDIINLSLGDPDFTTDEKIIQLAAEDAKNGHTHYTDSLGDMELRQEIVKNYKSSYNYNAEISEVMVVVGACHGMHLVLEAILDDGDEVIVPEPFFTPYVNQIELSRGKCVTLKTYEEEDFQVNSVRLKQLITNRTKAIIINSPNNPTGACYSKETLQSIAQVAIENDLVVIADDVYGAFSFKDPVIPIASFSGMRERTITIGSFSKDYAMTGWRIGYVMAPSFIIDCVRDINEGITYTAPAISQRAAVYALRMKDTVTPPLVGEYKKRVFYAYERIKKVPKLSVIEPQGTFYMMVNIKNSGLNSVEFCEKLLEEAQVLAIPGIAFGDSGEGYIRIACTVGVEQLKTAFDRIEKMQILND